MPDPDADDWVYTPGAYITYPVYDYRPTERRESLAFQSRLPYRRRSAADDRRAQHGTVGWNSSLKVPYRPLGTPRFDITARPKPPGDDARIQIRHPSRGKASQYGGRGSEVHKALETGKEVMGKVAQFGYQVGVPCACGGRARVHGTARATSSPLHSALPCPRRFRATVWARGVRTRPRSTT
jgi:hypothetical protein